ncbi:MAG: type 4 pilus major pilin [Alphaproteobacteria bacterium]|nr:type 4 pilus major pilin [Alphaproteobacteria bacterium]
MNPVGVLLSVVAGLVAIVAVVGIYNGITASLKEGESIELLNQLRASVERIYSGQASYGASANADLVPIVRGFGKIPDGAKVGAAGSETIQHAFGGAVTILGNGGRFAITFHDLDNETCKDLGQAYAGRTRAGSGIVIMDVAATASSSVSTAAPTPRGIGWLNTNCNNGPAANDLTFVFG